MAAIDRVGTWAANALGTTLVLAMVRLTRLAVLGIMVLDVVDVLPFYLLLNTLCVR
jgi:hypothetical protein